VSIAATATALSSHVPRLAATPHPAVGLADGGFAAWEASGDLARIGSDGTLTAHATGLPRPAVAAFSHPGAPGDPLLLTCADNVRSAISIDQRTFTARTLVVDGLPRRAHPGLRIGNHYSVDRLDGSSLSLSGIFSPMAATWREGSALIAIPRDSYEVIALTPGR
jgi:hypothetical protein